MMADFQKISIFGKAGSPNSGKSDSSESAGTSPLCPQCGSKKLWRDGLRYSPFGDRIQRWLCRNCGFRFSDSDDVQRALSAFERVERVDTKAVKGRGDKAFECQICVEETKNLAATEIGKQAVAGDKQGTQPKWTLQFLWTLKKEGVRENTAKMYWYILTNLESHGANLLDPESVKEVIAEHNWDESTKALAVSAYSKYLEVFGGTWRKPKYKRERKVPFLPTEKEVDCLINAGHKKLAAYLRLLKETGIRANEAWQVKWIDIDIERSIITLNQTEKHGTPRNFRVSSALIGMLNALPKKSDRVFNGSLIGFCKGFRRFRSRIANKMQNPRLTKIHFHTYRHWFATMEYHRTKDILHVKERLGHKSVSTTEIYMHLIDFEDDDFYSATASTVEEARKLAESGWEKWDTLNGVHIYRKRK
jgi:integrase/predicted RNA-binding Zn-ribbon protein involved in translation (DUF1610 family)